MRIEFTYRFTDLNEALMPASRSRRKSGHGRSVLRVLGLALCTVFATFWVVMFFVVGPGANKPWPLAGKPIDLVSDVFPALAPAALLCTLFLFSGWQSWRRARIPPAPPGPSQRQAGPQILAMIVILLIVFGTIALFEHAEFLLWTPTRTQRFLVSGGPWVVTILLLVVFGFANHRWTIRAKWLTPGWRRPKVVEIDAMGYLVIDELTQFRYAWGYFTAARETENLLILVAEDSQRHIIPKRAFVSPADLHRCKALLQGVITNTSFWAAPPTGFEMIPTPVLPLPTLPVERSKREMDGRESDPTIPSAPT